MSRFSLCRLAIPLLACSVLPAHAQDLDRGKSPSQIFSSNCTACHRGPQGLSRASNVGATATFLRDHYTTSAESAGAIAAYLASVGGDPRTARLRPPTTEAPEPTQRAVPAQNADVEERRERAAPREGAGEAAAPRGRGRKPGEPATVTSDPPPVITSSDPTPLVQDRVAVQTPPLRQAAATSRRDGAPGGRAGNAYFPATPPTEPAAAVTVPEGPGVAVVPPPVDLDIGLQEGFSSPLP